MSRKRDEGEGEGEGEGEKLYVRTEEEVQQGGGKLRNRLNFEDIFVNRKVRSERESFTDYLNPLKKR